MAVSILNFTCNQMFPFDGHLLATSPQQTIKLQLNLTLTSRSMASFLCYYCYQPIKKKKHEDENVGFNLTR
jgi:hypothetical protein